MAVRRQDGMKILARNPQERSRTDSVFSQPIFNGSYGQEQSGDDPASPHEMRSFLCGGDGPLKTRAKGSDRLLLTRQHSTFDQDCQTRMWIDAAQRLPGESARLNNFLIS